MNSQVQDVEHSKQELERLIRDLTSDMTMMFRACLLYTSSDQYKLYKLVWERFIASQMANAILDTVSADINAKEYTFKASGYTVRFPGYTVLYEESKDEETEKQGSLPDLKKQDPVPVSYTHLYWSKSNNSFPGSIQMPL